MNVSLLNGLIIVVGIAGLAMADAPQPKPAIVHHAKPKPSPNAFCVGGDSGHTPACWTTREKTICYAGPKPTEITCFTDAFDKLDIHAR